MPISLTPPQAKRIIDTLNVVPKVRREAEAWRGSSGYYRWQADTATKANISMRSAVKVAVGRLALNEVLLKSSEADTKRYKKLAQRRGVVNVLAFLGILVLSYAVVKN